jgi:hypothetical protein
LRNREECQGMNFSRAASVSKNERASAAEVPAPSG